MKIKQSFRFGDLSVGDKFYAESDPYTTGIVASDWSNGNAWFGSQKRYFHENAPVTPADVKAIALSKLAAYRRLAKEFGLTYAELRDGYRNLVVTTSHNQYCERRALTVEVLESPLGKALCKCGLIFRHANDKFYVSGYANQLYI